MPSLGEIRVGGGERLFEKAREGVFPRAPGENGQGLARMAILDRKAVG